MVQDALNPVTGNGTGADSQNQAGKWYSIKYVTTDIGEGILNCGWLAHEVVFIPSGESLAKHIRKYVRKHSVEGFPFSRDRSSESRLQMINDEYIRKGIYGGVMCLVLEVTLLTPDGQKISGFRPKSIANLFKDYVRPTKACPPVDDHCEEDY